MCQELDPSRQSGQREEAVDLEHMGDGQKELGGRREQDQAGCWWLRTKLQLYCRHRGGSLRDRKHGDNTMASMEGQRA